MAQRLSIQGRRLTPKAETSLFRLGLDAGIFIPSSCGGQGKCRECLLELVQGAEDLSAAAPEEEGLAEGFRLACRTTVTGNDADQIVCHTLTRGRLRIVSDSQELDTEMTELDPAVRRLGDAAVRGAAVLAEAPRQILGLAIDLGTTSIAMRLCDLESGRSLAQQSFENPQRFGGSDVMARIAFDGRHRGRLLQRTLIAYLGRAIDALPGDPREIFEVVVAGNTTMRDLFFGLDVQPIGQDPYRSITETGMLAGERTTTAVESTAPRLGLPVHPDALVIGMPLIASHLGADAAAALLATGVGHGSPVRVLMDIGTNTELILGNEGRLIAASCPAGPAFEGGGIRHGMPGVDGAIERVELLSDGSLQLGVIGDMPPQGICGSGLVAVLSELLRVERMNELGRFEEEEDEDGVRLDSAGEISFHESDVNELAQAKGANAAGIRVLLETYGIGASEIERFYLAGGFGRHLDARAARRIGLVPDLDEETLVQVGNASLEGARRYLLSCPARIELEERVKRIEHVRLELHVGFFDAFVEGCQFRPFGKPRA